MASSCILAWDFDGVLNARIQDVRFHWGDDLEEATGQSKDVFEAHVFKRYFDTVLTGCEDLCERVARSADAVGYTDGADILLVDDLAENVEAARAIGCGAILPTDKTRRELPAFLEAHTGVRV